MAKQQCSPMMLGKALVTNFGSHLFLGHDFSHMVSGHLQIIAPILLITIGLSLFINSKEASNKKCCGGHTHEHRSNSKVPILIGLSIGLYPCPTLIATYVSSVCSGRLNLGKAAVGLFALGSFISILLSALTLKYIGSKVTGTLKEKSSQLNWKKIQGALIMLVGLASLFHN